MLEYPVVSTVEELDALPFGTTILNVRFTVTNGHRPWSKVDLRWGDGTPNPKQWASYNSKYRDADMLINRRGGNQKYWILFQPETEPVIEEVEDEDGV